MIAGGGDGGNAKAAEKSRKEEIEAEKKRIREVSAASRHSVVHNAIIPAVSDDSHYCFC